MCGTRRMASRSTLTTHLRPARGKWRCRTTFATTIMAPCWTGHSLIPGLFGIILHSHTHADTCAQICELSPPSFTAATRVCAPMTRMSGLGGWLRAWIRAFWECALEKDASSLCRRHSDTERMEMVSINNFFITIYFLPSVFSSNPLMSDNWKMATTTDKWKLILGNNKSFKIRFTSCSLG